MQFSTFEGWHGKITKDYTVLALAVSLMAIMIDTSKSSTYNAGAKLKSTSWTIYKTSYLLSYMYIPEINENVGITCHQEVTKALDRKPAM